MKIWKKTDLMLLILAAAVAFICLIVRQTLQSGVRMEETERYVVIEVAGEETARLSLNENTSCTVDLEGMYNVIVVEDGSVYMSEANCPGLNCVRQGKVSEVGVPIVCLPHQVIVMIVEETP